MKITLIMGVIGLLFFISFVTLFILIGRSLWKYLKTNNVRQEKYEIRRTLGETLKNHRVSCKMTQEFVAETIGVSRQAVSKWETGVADPSTSNLIALAKLYEVSAEDLIKQVQ